MAETAIFAKWRRCYSGCEQRWIHIEWRSVLRRIGLTAELLARNGVIVLVAVIFRYRAIRDEIQARIAVVIEVTASLTMRALLHVREQSALGYSTRSRHRPLE